ncbi:hypothetical protein [Paracidovorax citrulli]
MRHNCDNCGWEGTEEQLERLSAPPERVNAGELMPCGECPECGAVVSVADAAIPEHTIQAIVSVLCARGSPVAEFTTMEEPKLIPSRGFHQDENVIEEEAQFEANIAAVEKEAQTDAIGNADAHLNNAGLPTYTEVRALAVQLDDYLRAVRSEELDGSEPVLGELLDRASKILRHA